MSQYRIAVATADGVKVDQHFGSASRFDIYRIDDGIPVIEKTVDFGSSEGCSGDHSGAEERLAIVEECQYVIAARIGSKIQRYFEIQKKKYFEMSGYDTQYVISKITEYRSRTGKER